MLTEITSNPMRWLKKFGMLYGIIVVVNGVYQLVGGEEMIKTRLPEQLQPYTAVLLPAFIRALEFNAVSYTAFRYACSSS